MTTPDPLAASALCAVPEVQRWYSELLRWANHPEAESQILRRGMCARELDALLLAVRDATLKAERSRLLGLTPEQVVGEVAERALRDMASPTCYAGCDCRSCFDLRRKAVRAALPLLLAPEVAKREQAERERDGILEASEQSLGIRLQWLDRMNAAEAERDRLRVALEKAEGIVSRFVKARDAFHYDNFGGEVERHLERAMEDAYGFLHGLPDDLRAALGGSNG